MCEVIWNLMVIGLAIFGQDTPPPVQVPTPSFWTSAQFFGFLGICVTVLGSFAVAIRTSKTSPTSSQNTAPAPQASYQELWTKVNDLESEVDDVKGKIRDWHLHNFRVQQWDITGRKGPLPEPPESLLEV